MATHLTWQCGSLENHHGTILSRFVWNHFMFDCGCDLCKQRWIPAVDTIILIENQRLELRKCFIWYKLPNLSINSHLVNPRLPMTKASLAKPFYYYAHNTTASQKQTNLFRKKNRMLRKNEISSDFDIKVYFLGISDITGTPDLISLTTECLFDDSKYYRNCSHEAVSIKECYMSGRGIGSFIFGHIIETHCSHHVNSNSTA